MLHLGDFNELQVARFVPFGLYLASSDGDILLPQKYVPEGTQEGDWLRVFVYRDSEDRIVATTLEPQATVGHFAVLTVKQTSDFGAFLDWGLEKDLMVPFKQQRERMQVGEKYTVYVYLDETTDRIVGTSKIYPYLEGDARELEINQPVELLVIEETDLGFRVIVDEAYLGMLFSNELFRPVAIGERLSGFVKNIRADNKVDVSLQKLGMDEVDSAKQTILELLEREEGILRLTDSSDPADIKAQLAMSKKLFKKAVGGLYREGQITLEPDHIRRTEKQ